MKTLSIHSTAIIDPTAQIGEGVEIGPYAVIGPNCKVGNETQILAHAVLESNVTLGQNCQISPGAVLGGAPQDLNFGGEQTFVEIGDQVIIRECVTINRATGEGNITRVGNGCMLMAYSHLAHNCQLGEQVILANNIQLGGYVEIGDYAFLGGMGVVHQFVKIGRMAMIGGFSASRKDIPPFATVFGAPATVKGLNLVGLKRRGVDREQRSNLKKAFYYIWFSGLNTQQALEKIETDLPPDPYVLELVDFVCHSKRGITHYRSNTAENQALEEPMEGELSAL